MLLESVSCQNYLKEELTRRIRQNPRYSQRAFARQLGLSPGELSEVMRGKRALGFRSVVRVAQALGLNAAEAKHLMQLSQLDRGGDAAQSLLQPALDQTLESRQLSLDFFHLVSDWYCFAILNLAETERARMESAYIARRLGISRTEAQLALDRLERVGLIERKQGRLLVTQDYVISAGGAPSEAIRNYHRQVLRKAEAALDVQDLATREISGLGIALDPRHVPAIKREIAEFQDRLVARYSKGKKTEVYQVEIAFFRLSDGSGSDELKKNGERK